ncbi:flagellin [Roseospirillum parvum]|uniref:Flagellar hook-associated protein 3 FlgL n=1 Tax=Roseospirillum parvum TaxID=83401 RepID=A0A1G8ANV5_9PROT|nr:flagellin [Roseospirillum parvum]SDH22675.1 flagellar hook-associated protein 3 FlgL [Roseospirillum parvum]
MRVATHTMNSTLLAQALEAQGRYNQALVEQASGLKSESLSGLDGQAGQVVSLTADLAASEHLVSQAETAASQVEAAYAAIDGMLDILSSTSTSVAAQISGSSDGSDTSTLQDKAAAWLADLQTLLNTSQGDTHVFAGTLGSRAPVDVDAAGYDPLADPTQPDTGYYQGGAEPRSLMLGGEQSLTHGVTADEKAFEQALRALAMLADDANQPLTTATLGEAQALIDQAVSGMGALQERLSAQSDSLETLSDVQTEFQLYAAALLEDVTSVDVAESAAKVSERELVLQASYAALSSLKSLSLVDYL